MVNGFSRLTMAPLAPTRAGCARAWPSRAQLSLPVGRVARVDRPSIRSDLGRVAAKLLRALRRVVAGLAQALQFARDECVPVTAMRLDMVSDGGAGDAAVIEAQLAERMLA